MGRLGSRLTLNVETSEKLNKAFLAIFEQTGSTMLPAACVSANTGKSADTDTRC